jgi:hypothetical protein
VIDFLFYYSIFAICTGIATMFNVWLPIRGIAIQLVPQIEKELRSIYLYFVMFIVGVIFAPYMFWETIFGPSKPLVEGVIKGMFRGSKK